VSVVVFAAHPRQHQRNQADQHAEAAREDEHGRIAGQHVEGEGGAGHLVVINRDVLPAS